MSGALESIDALLNDIIASWNIHTSVLATLLTLFIAYPLFFYYEPDVHPFFLIKQSRTSPLRLQNESATYRSIEVPHGYPLRSGLDIKDDDAPRWKAGRDGDLRDIWKTVVSGTSNNKGGEIMTVLGQEELLRHDIKKLDREIMTLGIHLQRLDVHRVAICLPNSIELLCALLACVFYGITPILIRYGEPQAETFAILRAAEADLIITKAGSLALAQLEQAKTTIRSAIWVADRTSRHMAWTEEQKQPSNKIETSTWHSIVESIAGPPTRASPNSESQEAVNVGFVSAGTRESPRQPSLVEFTQKNLIAGVAGVLFALPAKHRLCHSDLVFPADSLCSPYVLCQVLAALFSHASLVLNTVAKDDIDMVVASRGIAPTVVIASEQSLRKLHARLLASTSRKSLGFFVRLARHYKGRALDAGALRDNTFLHQFLGGSPEMGTISSKSPGRLRLILASHPAESKERKPIHLSEMHDLRIDTGARISIALTAACVAGAVTQMNVCDYRRDPPRATGRVGVAVPSIEIKLQNDDDDEVKSHNPSGEILAHGPAVKGGLARLGVSGMILNDGSLALTSV